MKTFKCPIHKNFEFQEVEGQYSYFLSCCNKYYNLDRELLINNPPKYCYKCGVEESLANEIEYKGIKGFTRFQIKKWFKPKEILLCSVCAFSKLGYRSL